MTADTALDLAGVRRSELVDSRGVGYFELRESLTPRFALVWAHIALGWVVVLGISVGLFATTDVVHGFVVRSVLTVVGGAALGFWLHYLLLFQHEGAHFNLARTPRANDRLTNLAVGIFIAEDVRNYRRVHLEHHRYLGTTRDTERSYFDPLDARFVVEALSGIRLVRALAARRRVVAADAATEPPVPMLNPTFLAALVLNASVVILSWLTGHWVLSAGWVLGALVFMPFLNATRQLLEHRSEFAEPGTDFTSVAHGAVNRLFGNGLLASTLGAAGFNRHLLHHWDSGVSYTRLAELEAFLLDTDVAPVLEQRHTSYVAAARRLASR